MASQSWIDKDFYAILGVSKDAAAEEIKKAYRKLALEHHPDRNPDDPSAEDRFKDVGEAYEVLSNPGKRREYDQLRDAVAAGAGGGWPGGRFRVEDFGFSQEGFDVDDLLRTIFGGRFGGSPFGGRGRAPGPQRGRDVVGDVTLSFEEAARGTERRLTVDAGSGQRQEVTVRIPAGVDDGARVRVKGRGESGAAGAPAGDLYVRVNVAPHPVFGRNGEHITLTLPITFTEAALGANVKVPTLDEPVTLKIPPGTSSGQTFRIRGRGIDHASRGKGDLLATVQVAVPQKLSRKERELLEELAEVGDGSPRTHLGV